MKRIILLVISISLNLLLLFTLFLFFYKNANKKEVDDYLNFDRYRSENISFKNDVTEAYNTIFIGNSITANWINLRPDFFHTNKFLNRGVGGQTSSQILLRFQQDVVDLGIKTVVLNVGINDIAEGDGFYNKNFTIQNIKSIIAICKANNINLILTSVLPVTEIRKDRITSIKNVQFKIEELNKEILKLAVSNDLRYIDYNKNLKNTDGKFNDLYTFDGVHPNEEGYKIMESIILKELK